jgi:CRP/FNR family transcriptional regulator, cyclic AMP receptor protein
MTTDQNRLIEMCKGENQRQFKRLRTILYQGEVPKSVYIIKKGVIRAYNIAENGEERNVELLSDGDVLPISWVFNISNAALYYYDAFSDVQLFVLSKERFNELIKTNNLEYELLKLTSRRYTATTMHINALLQAHAQNKIAQGLQYLALSHGTRLGSGKHRVNIRLTQQDLANLVGVTRETAAVELNKLRDKGVIQYRSFTYTIDYDALIRATGSDEFDGLRL